MSGPFDTADYTPGYRTRIAQLEAEVTRLREALREITEWAEAARGHYGIEECSGPGKPATEWDEVQDGLRSSALFARAALEASSSEPRP